MGSICSFLGLVIAMPCVARDPVPDSLVALARSAVISEVMGKALPKVTDAEPAKPVFVTIERNGKVLGCRGYLDAHGSSLQASVIDAARAAAQHDPRYPPLRPADLKSFLVTVTIVEREESIDSVASLGPGDGLVLRSGNRTGVVLPWEGKDPQIRLRWAYKKAGVQVGSAVRLSRLIAERIRG